MKKYGLIIIGIAVTLIIVLSYVGNSSQNTVQEILNTKPKHHTTTGFRNDPYIETAAPKGLLFFLRRFWGSVFIPDVPDGHELPDSESIRMLNSIKGDRIGWLGHASFLITLTGKTILTDPFFSEFASPVSWAGPRRIVGTGIPLDKLPPIDVVVISHDHYDHLDHETVTNLKNKAHIHVVVPLGLKTFFTERGYTKITELDWGQSVSIDGIQFSSLPAVHDSGRSVGNKNQTLWASWVIESLEKKIIFIGDTGYSETVFKRIGNKYSSFDYAILPIGAYEPRELMRMSHVTPEEAVKIGNDVHAKVMIASHWGTVSSLSDEPFWEPPRRFSKAGSKKGFSEKSLWVMKVGESRSLSLEVSPQQ